MTRTIMTSPYVEAGSSGDTRYNYHQYLADIAIDDNAAGLHDEAVFRLNNNLGNVFIDGGLIGSDNVVSDLHNVNRNIHDINNKLMDDIATTLKADLEQERLFDTSTIDFDVNNLSRDVLLAGTSDVTYTASPLGQEALGSNKYGVERGVFDEAYARKFTAEGDRLLAEDWKVSTESVELVSHRNEAFAQDEAMKFNAMTGQLNSYHDMPMTTEFAQAAFEQFDRDKDEAIAEGYPEEEVKAAYENLVDYCDHQWRSYGIDAEVAYARAVNARVEEKGVPSQDPRFAALDDYVNKFDKENNLDMGFER